MSKKIEYWYDHVKMITASITRICLQQMPKARVIIHQKQQNCINDAQHCLVDNRPCSIHQMYLGEIKQFAVTVCGICSWLQQCKLIQIGQDLIAVSLKVHCQLFY